MKSIEISARTVAEAIQLALAQLAKDRDEVAIEVLEAGSEEEEALVRVTAVDDDEERLRKHPAASTGNVDQIARRILEDLLERMDIQAMSRRCIPACRASAASRKTPSRCMSRAPMKRRWAC